MPDGRKGASTHTADENPVYEDVVPLDKDTSNVSVVFEGWCAIFCTAAPEVLLPDVFVEDESRVQGAQFAPVSRDRVRIMTTLSKANAFLAFNRSSMKQNPGSCVCLKCGITTHQFASNFRRSRTVG